MNLYVIDTGFFKLDGGAMFGVVPKSIWNRKHPADENNMCTWAMRCLLVETGDRLILIDTGMGNKQSEKFFGFYYLQDTVTLEDSLAKHGFSVNDVTDVFLTHLHFDHVGGAIQWDNGKEKLVPTFPNARYWSNESHWDWAVNPNPREKASFLKENILPIRESGQLNFVRESDWLTPDVFPGFDVLFVNGHTEKQMLPVLHYKGHTIIYTADLIPSVHHLGLAYVMGYDVRPLDTMQERQRLYNEFIPQDALLFFEHDAHHELAIPETTERGVKVSQTLSLKEL